MASASLTGIDQSPVKITLQVIFGIHAAGAEREGVDVAQHLRNRLGGDEAELLRLGHVAGDDARQVLALVDVAEVAADVGRVLAFLVQAAAVQEGDVRDTSWPP